MSHRQASCRRWMTAIFLLILAAPASAAPPLPALGAEAKVTVSGLSSGGFMAAQFAVAFSKDVSGVAVVAGGPYDCAGGSAIEATTRCSCFAPPLCSTPTSSVLAFQSEERASGHAAVSLVDPLANLKTQRVWLFWGGHDKTVPPANVKAIRMFYVDQIKAPAGHVKTRHLAAAAHGLPVLSSTGTVACGTQSYPFLIDCGLDAAGELLAWLYPGSTTRAPVTNGHLIEFDQTRYEAGLDYTGLAATGYVYVPDPCTAAGAACRVHVVFHGCGQARDASDGAGGKVDATFVERAGYNPWAAGSRVVVLYPQVKPVDTGSPIGGFQDNPAGCWDFWGYTRLFPSTGVYATNAAPQMLAVRAMIAALQRP